MPLTRQTLMLMRWTVAFPSRSLAAAFRTNANRGGRVGRGGLSTTARAGSTTAPTHAPKGFGLKGGLSSRRESGDDGRFESRYRRPREGLGESRYRNDRDGDGSFEPSSSTTSTSTSTSRGSFWGENRRSRDEESRPPRREAGGMGRAELGGRGGTGGRGETGGFRRRGDERSGGFEFGGSGGSGGSRGSVFGLSKSDTRWAAEGESSSYGSYGSRRDGREPSRAYGDARRSRTIGGEPETEPGHGYGYEQSRSADRWSRDGPSHRLRGRGDGPSRFGSRGGPTRDRAEGGSTSRAGFGDGSGPRGSATRKDHGVGAGPNARPRPRSSAEGETDVDGDGAGPVARPRKGKSVEAELAARIQAADKRAGMGQGIHGSIGGSDARSTGSTGPSAVATSSASRSRRLPDRGLRHEEEYSTLSFPRPLTERLSAEDRIMGLTMTRGKPKWARHERGAGKNDAKLWRMRGNVASRRKRALEADEEEERAKSSGANQGAPWSDDLNEESSELSSSPANPLSATLTPTGKRPWEPTKKLTLPAMAGLRALHSADPVTFSRQVLSRRFGISYEAVSRILRSRFAETTLESGSPDQAQAQRQHHQYAARPSAVVATGPGAMSARGAGAGAEEDAQPSLKGTKWDMTPQSGEGISPAPAIQRAFRMRRTAMDMAEMARARRIAGAAVSNRDE
ncbi:Required for respiratory growth protein 9 mitochondrial [Saitozyma podzolica]|uniref:Required for respiratory growth protein 9, mitochondrial n=1 Tax=Saitozyma podzolica TaxID=1890683 RepID=A0A427YEK4_9TREE|nr:Required for respiratory growth protein 9 mitochondrial [Saitozyma podzolica]